MDFSRPLDELEQMDSEALPEQDLRGALRFLALTNRYFGGARVILSHLETWTAARPPNGPLHILDVGTGGGDIPVAVARWARHRGLPVRITAVDKLGSAVALARQRSRGFPEISVEERDVFELAKNGARFDVVAASLFLHHCRPDQQVPALKTFDRLAKRGIIISDLRRGRAGYWAVKLLSDAVGNAVVRHDAPLSVRRAFRAEELETLARQAGLSYLSARPQPWFRISLAGEKPMPGL